MELSYITAVSLLPSGVKDALAQPPGVGVTNFQTTPEFVETQRGSPAPPIADSFVASAEHARRPKGSNGEPVAAQVSPEFVEIQIGA
jgi:hypothetical protein